MSVLPQGSPRGRHVPSAGGAGGLAPRPPSRDADQTARSTIMCLIDAMALAGFNPLGQVLVQFMIV